MPNQNSTFTSTIHYLNNSQQPQYTQQTTTSPNFLSHLKQLPKSKSTISIQTSISNPNFSPQQTPYSPPPQQYSKHTPTQFPKPNKSHNYYQLTITYLTTNQIQTISTTKSSPNIILLIHHTIKLFSIHPPSIIQINFTIIHHKSQPSTKYKNPKHPTHFQTTPKPTISHTPHPTKPNTIQLTLQNHQSINNPTNTTPLSRTPNTLNYQKNQNPYYNPSFTNNNPLYNPFSHSQNKPHQQTKLPNNNS